jgi:hypothetical protein
MPYRIDGAFGSGSVLTRFRKALCERVRSAIGNVLTIRSDHRNRRNELDFRPREMLLSKYTVSIGHD